MKTNFKEIRKKPRIENTAGSDGRFFMAWSWIGKGNMFVGVYTGEKGKHPNSKKKDGEDKSIYLFFGGCEFEADPDVPDVHLQYFEEAVEIGVTVNFDHDLFKEGVKYGIVWSGKKLSKKTGYNYNIHEVWEVD